MNERVNVNVDTYDDIVIRMHILIKEQRTVYGTDVRKPASFCCDVQRSKTEAIVARVASLASRKLSHALKAAAAQRPLMRDTVFASFRRIPRRASVQPTKRSHPCTSWRPRMRRTARIAMCSRRCATRSMLLRLRRKLRSAIASSAYLDRVAATYDVMRGQK